jgi:hypothetical protein
VGQAIERARTSIGATVAATPTNGGTRAAVAPGSGTTGSDAPGQSAAEARRAAREAATTSAPLESSAKRRARTEPTAPPAPPPASAGMTRETTLDEAAVRLANDLRAVPGIERFGNVRLADLERTGPRPLRTMWRIARDRLDERYGQLTIGEVLDRYAGRGGGGGTGATA